MASPNKFDAEYFKRPSVTKSPLAARHYVELLHQRLAAPALVVDIGCATGVVPAEFARAGYEVIGLDLSVQALQQTVGPTGVAAADAEAVPLRRGSVDAALCLDVIEHLSSPWSALLELRRVVRDGGILVVTTPNAGSPLRRVLGRRWHGLEDDTHLYFFTAFSLGHLLEKTGWTSRRVAMTSGAPNPAGNVLGWLRCGGELCIVATAD